MSFVKWKLEHTPFKDGVWDTGSTTTLESYYDVLVNVALGADNKDSFNFKITNVDGKYTNRFNINDKITIYRVSNSLTTSTDNIIMVGTLKEVPIEQNGTKNVLKLQGYNFSEAVLSAITFVDLENYTVSYGIKQAIDQVGGANQNFKVTWHPDNKFTNSTGGAFPTIGKKFYYKPLKTIIEKYSVPDKTEDGYYYYYVDNANRFVWKQQNEYPEGQTFIQSTETYKDIKISRDIKGIRNYVIIKGGNDPTNKQMQVQRQNWSSIAKHGMKFYFMASDANYAKNKIKIDIGADETVDSFPTITSSAFTTKWKSSTTETVTGGFGTINMVTGSVVTIDLGSETNNKLGYAAVIRAEAIYNLTQEADNFLRNYEFGKLKVDITFIPGQKTWGLGERIRCLIPEISSDIKELRVNEIQYSTTGDVYSLSEDEGTV